MEFILDLIFIVIIASGIWSGYKKGIVMGIGAICVLIVSVFVGNMLSNAYSQEVLPAMQPFASGYVNSLSNENVLEVLGLETSDKSIGDLYKENPYIAQDVAYKTYIDLGLNSDAATTMAEDTVARIDSENSSVADAITYILCSKIAFAIAFLIFALLCMIILTVIGNIANFSYRIPHIGAANEYVGAVLGLVTAIFFCTVIAWTLRFCGIIMPDGFLESTRIVEFFMNHNMLSSYLGI